MLTGSGPGTGGAATAGLAAVISAGGAATAGLAAVISAGDAGRDIRITGAATAMRSSVLGSSRTNLAPHLGHLVLTEEPGRGFSVAPHSGQVHLPGNMGGAFLPEKP